MRFKTLDDLLAEPEAVPSDAPAQPDVPAAPSTTPENTNFVSEDQVLEVTVTRERRSFRDGCVFCWPG